MNETIVTNETIVMNETIAPVYMRGFRRPTDVEMAVDETLKVCGISGDDATALYIEVMHRLARLGIVTDQVKYECGCALDREQKGERNNGYTKGVEDEY